MTGTLQTTEQRYCTEEQYLALEETAEYKSEYLDGEIIPMTGGSTNHNRNLAVLLMKDREHQLPYRRNL